MGAAGQAEDRGREHSRDPGRRAFLFPQVWKSRAAQPSVPSEGARRGLADQAAAEANRYRMRS